MSWAYQPTTRQVGRLHGPRGPARTTHATAQKNGLLEDEVKSVGGIEEQNQAETALSCLSVCISLSHPRLQFPSPFLLYLMNPEP
jgi:hypothetical protein